MDRSEVRRIVLEHAEPLKRALGIPHWHIVVDYDMRRSSGDFDTAGECVWHVDYNRAAISLDPETFADEAEVLRVLRHELFHIVLSPFTVFLNTVKPLLRDDEVKAAMAENVWTHACEKAVINLERMWFGVNEYRKNVEAQCPEPPPMAKKPKMPKSPKPPKMPAKGGPKGTKSSKGGGKMC